MALKVTGFAASSLPYKVISEGASTNTLNSNVTGISGNLHSMDLGNQANGTVYVKIHMGVGGTLAGAEDIKIRLQTGNAGAKRFVMPAGIAFSEFTFYTTTTSGESATPAAPSTAGIHSFTTT